MELQLEISKQETARFKAQANLLYENLQQAQASLSEVQRFSSRVPFMLTFRKGERTCR